MPYHLQRHDITSENHENTQECILKLV